MSEPAWERLRAADHRPLQVGEVVRLGVDRLRVVNGMLPDHRGAVVFDAWPRGTGAVVRAATLDDVRVTPFEIETASLVIEGSDGRLEALLRGAGRVSAAGNLERQACACRGVSTDVAYAAMAGGWATVDAVKRATRVGFGPCQGRRCVPWLAERLELDADDPLAQITPRPPLVPVPISILAAFTPDR
ncbi:MAG TPA: (2Fe-2S)-binding protein [Candidatus Angelobacter sp.]|nr:(2Fe-2S)-binding protein [Candidatus Angelobacter sp.]